MIEKIADEVSRLILLEYNCPIYFENVPEIISSNSFGVDLVSYKITNINKNTNLENVELLITYLLKNDNIDFNIFGKEKYKVVDKLKSIFGKGRMYVENRYINVNVEYKQVINKLGLCLKFEYYQDAYSSTEVYETMNEIIHVNKGL